MQTQSQSKIVKRFKKSHILLFGSFLIFGSVLFVSWDYLVKMRDAVFSDMLISMMDVDTEAIVTDDQPVEEAIPETVENVVSKPIDYSKYLGVLEIPKIWLKRGFFGTDSRYNNISYNVTMVKGSSLPDVGGGNLILMAHSGDSYISYFAYLYKLSVGDDCYITYAGNRYQYRIVNIYEVNKNGLVTIKRNRDRTTLTLITCTKDSDVLQTVYIAELIG